MRPTTRLTTRRSGFTLLELIIVMAILVALAGLVIAKLDVLQLKSQKAAAATQIRDVGRMIQIFRATTNTYPDRWDSLVDRSGGTAVLKQPGLPGGNPGLDPGLVGGPPTGAHTKLTLLPALTTDQARSLNRLGITTVFDHNGATTLPYGNGFVSANTISGGSQNVFATINAADDDGQAIISEIYPTPPGTGATPVLATVPSDRVLVVFGLGKYCTLVGANLQNSVLSEAPVYPYEAAQYYDRFLAIFEVYNSGDRARLVGVLGADGDRASEEIADFKQN